MDHSEKTEQTEQNTTFADLGLSPRVLDAITKKGFEEPSPIQALTIPFLLQKQQNVIAQAQTGTGKTAAFALPLVEKINPSSKKVQALVLAPTRELAVQVSEEINSLKGQTKLSVTPVYGGQSYSQQLRALKKGTQIVVGTPGRVIDHINRGTLDLSQINFLILDEADEMLNMGFLEDMEEIMQKSNPQKRTLLFSATMPSRIKDLAKKYMGDYQLLAVKKQQLTTNLTEQIYYEVRHSDKFEALCRIIDIEEDFYGVIFCRTKNDVDEVSQHLNSRGYFSDAIHGDISQHQREKTLKKFKSQSINILVATDVAARGIDVNNLTHVINYSLPHNPEAYVHRIGRTGRAGNEGTAITFITPNEYRKLMFIQRISKSEIKKSTLPKVKDLILTKKAKISQELEQITDQDIHENFFNWAKNLLEDQNPTQTLAKILAYCFHEELDPTKYQEITEAKKRNDKRDRSNKRNRDRSQEPTGKGRARLFVALGKKHKINPPRLVKMITSTTNIKGHIIDQVQVYDNFSFITVPFKEAEIILKAFKKNPKGGNKPLITKAKKR